MKARTSTDAGGGKWASTRRCAAGAICAVTAFALVLGATPASALQTHLLIGAFGSAEEVTFTSSGGSGAVTRVQATGDLLVVDQGAFTVRRFKSDGTPRDFSALGTNVIDAKKGPGGKTCSEEPASCDQTPQNGFYFTSFPTETQIAVDESGGLTDGNIYVAQSNQLAGNLVDIFAPSGKYLGQITAAGGTVLGGGSFPFGPCGVAVDVAGDLFVGGGFDETIYRFKQPAVVHDPLENGDGSAFSTVSGGLCGLAVGAGPTAGSIFVAAQGYATKIDAASGAVEYLIDNGESSAVMQSVAVNPDNGHLYVGSRLDTGGTDSQIQEYDASGSSAKLLAAIPRNKVVAAAGAGTEERVYASNGNRRLDVYGPRATLPEPKTGEATEIEEPSVVVNGTVNPDGEALTECYFGYEQVGTTTEYTEPCAEPVGAIGAGHSPVPVHAKLEGLPTETEFRVGLRVANANAALYPKDRRGVAGGGTSFFTTPGKPLIGDIWATSVSTDSASIRARINPQNLSTTYRFEWGPAGVPFEHSTAEIALGSDAVSRTVGRLLSGLTPGATYHYRVVSTNNLGTVEAEGTFTTFRVGTPEGDDCPNRALRTGPSASLPDCRAYEMVSPLDKNNGDILSLTQVTGYYVPFYQAASSGEALTFSSYRAFPDAQGASYSSQYIARRSPSGWVTRAISPPQGVTLGSVLTYDNQFLAATPDLSSGWFLRNSDPPLTADAPPGFLNLYRRDNASGSFEALNTVTPPHPAREFDPRLQGVSADGDHAVFVANDNLADGARVNNVNQLYLFSKGGALRLVSFLPNGTASKADSTAGTRDSGYTGVGDLRFGSFTHALSEDGSRVFWTTGGHLYLRLNAHREPSAIVGGECTEPAKACTIPVSETVSSSQAKFIVANPDGSVVYFSIGSARYAFDVTTRKATLLAPSQTIPVPTGDFTNASRMTPDGTHLAFVSTARLTGYDNTDAVSGEADREVYLSEVGGETICVSCNPTGARPIAQRGREAFSKRYKYINRLADIPGWQTTLYGSRALSDDANRLFFNSFEALTANDTNGAMDVYEWERAGTGSCTEESPYFHTANGGCLYLISSGEGQGNSEFVDASPDGRDVFFTTEAGLVPQDFGLIDIYNARVEGGFPPPPDSPAVCEGEACQGNPEGPNDVTSASEAFEGPGNLREPAVVSRRCARGKIKQRGRCVARKHRRCARGKIKRRGRCVARKHRKRSTATRTRHSRRAER